jgi:hypothetical protein
MKIWYDACTGKHVRYGAAIAKSLRKSRHEVILTTREHPDTVPLAKLLGEDFLIVGKYSTESLRVRLREGLKRQLFFLKLFKDSPPDVSICHGSVDLCRVAFGLKIPIISTFDTPHAEAVNRLTIPLTDFLVVSKAIPQKLLKRFNPKVKIIQFNGVDEVAWIKNFRPQILYDFEEPLIVVREFEARAAYAQEGGNLFEVIARKLTKIGKVIFLPRYERNPRKGLIVPKYFIDSASLVAQADLFVGAGGTMAREAALQGTPTIVVEAKLKHYTNDYLARMGFPIFKTKASKVLEYAEKLLNRKENVGHLLANLENPVDVIEKIIKGNILKGKTSKL